MDTHPLAIVLHVRPYRETSVIAQFLTREEGRLAGVYRGAKRRSQTIIQPFATGMLTVTGRSSLATVTRFEQEHAYALHDDALVAGFYVLELITRLLAERQSEPGVFAATHEVLRLLAAGADVEATLRPYELALLEELGYGIDFLHDAASGASIVAERGYVFRNELGFCEAPAARARYPGSALLAIAERDFSNPRVANAAKRIVREALGPLLGGKPLVSRRMLPTRSRAKPR